MSQIVVVTDLRTKFGPARDQGSRPTCMAFAASDAHAALRGAWRPLSCEYAFFHAQRRAGRPPAIGALLSSMLEALREDGQPEEAAWPYSDKTPDAKSWAPPKKLSSLFARNGQKVQHSFDRVVAALDQGNPVVVLLMLSQAFRKPTSDAIIDPAAGEVPEPQRRHAVIAVAHGMVDGQRAILIRNSWGQNWGDRGYGWLTEKFLAPRIFAAAVLLEDIDVSGNPTTT